MTVYNFLVDSILITKYSYFVDCELVTRYVSYSSKWWLRVCSTGHETYIKHWEYRNHCIMRFESRPYTSGVPLCCLLSVGIAVNL